MYLYQETAGHLQRRITVKASECCVVPWFPLCPVQVLWTHPISAEPARDTTGISLLQFGIIANQQIPSFSLWHPSSRRIGARKQGLECVWLQKFTLMNWFWYLGWDGINTGNCIPKSHTHTHTHTLVITSPIDRKGITSRLGAVFQSIYDLDVKMTMSGSSEITAESAAIVCLAVCV